ncbi:MAG: hypothetical protein E5V61_31765 [Mesorhizobium sp.]|nr:MAG: hypothetical protein E5V61_31765 [Mesorhizobium sp.]
MSDDSFIREVNEEIRREQAQALWDRFGPALLGLAILIVLGTAAVKDFDDVAADTAIPQAIRDMARLRAALLLVDTGSFAEVSSRVEALTADTNTLRHTAREALGLAAWKEGKTADALKLFDQIASDDGAPRNARQRATLMSELIRGSGNAS